MKIQIATLILGLSLTLPALAQDYVVDDIEAMQSDISSADRQIRRSRSDDEAREAAVREAVTLRRILLGYIDFADDEGAIPDDELEEARTLQLETIVEVVELTASIGACDEGEDLYFRLPGLAAEPLDNSELLLARARSAIEECGGPDPFAVAEAVEVEPPVVEVQDPESPEAEPPALEDPDVEAPVVEAETTAELPDVESSTAALQSPEDEVAPVDDARSDVEAQGDGRRPTERSRLVVMHVPDESATPIEPERRERNGRPGAATAFSLGVLAIGGAVVVDFMDKSNVRDDFETLRDSCESGVVADCDELPALQDDIRRDRIIAGSLAGAGAVLAIGGFVGLVKRRGDRDDNRRTHFSPEVAPHYAGVRVDSRF